MYVSGKRHMNAGPCQFARDHSAILETQHFHCQHSRRAAPAQEKRVMEAQHLNRAAGSAGCDTGAYGRQSVCWDLAIRKPVIPEGTAVGIKAVDVHFAPSGLNSQVTGIRSAIVRRKCSMILWTAPAPQIMITGHVKGILAELGFQPQTGEGPVLQVVAVPQVSAANAEFSL
jgi:hypothetical protein